jgi:hypothetical protein
VKTISVKKLLEKFLFQKNYNLDKVAHRTGVSKTQLVWMQSDQPHIVNCRWSDLDVGLAVKALNRLSVRLGLV